jgi:SOS-response transcriptional repressor LexA
MRKLNPNLTPKQEQLLQVIKEFKSYKGYFPSYREMMKIMKYTSISSIQSLINHLITKGYIKKNDRYSNRAYCLVQDCEYIPSVGYIQIDGVCY